MRCLSMNVRSRRISISRRRIESTYGTVRKSLMTLVGEERGGLEDSIRRSQFRAAEVGFYIFFSFLHLVL